MKHTLFAALAFITTGCTLMTSDGSSSALSPDDEDDRTDQPDEDTPAPSCEVETHVIAVYETRGDHSAGNHPTGDAVVRIDRPGTHRLVLSAYEPTHWRVEATADARIESVHLVGYHAQTVDAEGAEVTTNTYDQGDFAVACGYHYPSNDGGCNTPGVMAFAERITANPVTTFHGCYHASQFVLRADGGMDANCEQTELTEYLGQCAADEPDPDPSGEWRRLDFEALGESSCQGERFVRFDGRQELYIGAVLCGDSRSYKLYASAQADGMFYEIADYGGHGQDHCEFVNPNFSLPDEDDITSGGCSECSVGEVIDLIGVPVYARASFGQPLVLTESVEWADLTNPVYRCGVSIP